MYQLNFFFIKEVETYTFFYDEAKFQNEKISRFIQSAGNSATKSSMLRMYSRSPKKRQNFYWAIFSQKFLDVRLANKTAVPSVLLWYNRRKKKDILIFRAHSSSATRMTMQSTVTLVNGCHITSTNAENFGFRD